MTFVNLAERVLDAYHEDYKDLLATWTALEGKAQGSVTIAGIFLAGAFTFVRYPQATLNTLERFLLALAVGALGASVLFAGSALRVRVVSNPQSGSQLERVLTDLERAVSEESLAKRYMRKFLQDEMHLWRQATEAFRSVLDAKASRVRRAHTTLSVGIVLIGCLTLSVIF